MPRLGVNIDHVATLRQARGGREPDPVWAATLAELAGADGITVHLREDRRHIQDRDLRILRETVRTRLNLEAAANPEIVEIAIAVKPDQITFVPEKRQERTTEGGLDLLAEFDRVQAAVNRCREANLSVSLFIDPIAAQVKAAAKLHAAAIELHTGAYALAATPDALERELKALVRAGRRAVDAGLTLHAGHGLNLENVAAVAAIPQMAELNIGHSIISRAVFIGIDQAVREMRARIDFATHKTATPAPDSNPQIQQSSKRK
jgi:pyridoxine 5-phosphate synthase